MDQGVTIGNMSGGSVILEVRDNIAIIRLGAPSERVVILTKQRLESLERAILDVEKNSAIHGLVIIGATPHLFCAGADIQAIQDVQDPAVGTTLARRGQEIFNKLASLSIPSVAAVAGACVGGGCELVLSCTHRILLNAPDTRIGLPEIKLGILPGFGGTQRLPRLIGLRQALDIILSGKVVSAEKALRIGLVDRLVELPSGGSAREDGFRELEALACEVALRKTALRRRKPSVSDIALTYTQIGHTLVQSRAKREILNNTKGLYPAPLRALEAVMFGLKSGIEAGYAEEAKALGELIVTKESKALVHIYFLTEAASKLGKAVKADLQGATAAVLGGGTMGAGIATALLANGLSVVLVDPVEEARNKASQHINEELSKRKSISATQLPNVLSRLKLSGALQDISKAAIVIEAVPETLELKQMVLGSISEHVGPEVVIASNTSSLSIKEISARVSHQKRIIGMHFFNPAEKMPLVEIVLGAETNERTIAYTAALTVQLGKYPIVVNQVPGFLVNRILTPYLVEAAHALSDGYRISDIDDTAVSFGMPMGPIRLLDEVGLDVAAHVVEILAKAYGNRMVGPSYIDKLVSLGRLGRKTRSGFYFYEGNEAKVDPVVPSLLGLPTTREQVKLNYTELTERLIFPMINEAVRALDEGVAGNAGKEAAGQIDLGSVMGFGFPPFRGGLLYFAQSFGAKAIYEKLKVFEDKFGARFAPCPGLTARAERGLSLYSAL